MQRPALIIKVRLAIVKLLPVSRKKKLPRRIAVVFVSAKESKLLNRQYRGKNRPTNVLSFNYGPDYGEILLCEPVVRREAKAQRNSYQYQMTWMILHGMLHLAGLHHEKSAKAATRVERVEQAILRKLFDNSANSK